jgi:hypothetical protein
MNAHFTLPANKLLGLLNFIPSDATRYSLRGIHLVRKNGSFMAETTDGHIGGRIYFEKDEAELCGEDDGKDFDMVLNSDIKPVLKVAASAKIGPRVVFITLNGRAIVDYFGQSITSDYVADQFPDMDRCFKSTPESVDSITFYPNLVASIDKFYKDIGLKNHSITPVFYGKDKPIIHRDSFNRFECVFMPARGE